MIQSEKMSTPHSGKQESKVKYLVISLKKNPNIMNSLFILIPVIIDACLLFSSLGVLFSSKDSPNKGNNSKEVRNVIIGYPF